MYTIYYLHGDSTEIIYTRNVPANELTETLRKCRAETNEKPHFRKEES